MYTDRKILTRWHYTVRRGQFVRSPAFDVAGASPEEVPPTLDQFAQIAHCTHAPVEAGPLDDLPLADHVAKVRSGRPLHCKKRETIIAIRLLSDANVHLISHTFEFG